MRRGHLARVRVGHADLLVLRIQLRQQFLVPVLPVLERGNLGSQITFAGGHAARFRRVRRVQFFQIPGQPGIGAGNQILKLVRIEVLVARIDRRELAAVNGQQLPAKKFQLAAQQGELPRHGLERLEIVFAEVGNGLEVGRLFAGEPDHLHVAVALGFQ